MIQGILCIPSHNQPSLGLLADGILILTGASILVGFLTPVLGMLAALVCLALALMWLPTPQVNFLNSKPLLFQMIVAAMAIALIGPGAYSLDARLFGWREIVIPPAPHKD